jgi:dephospho-CoA kinase
MGVLMRTIGLTGGIGSGKSTVAKILIEQEIPVIDADVLSRGLTQSGGAAIPLIEQAFGAAMIAQNGSLNRDAMRARMLQEPAAKVQLEAIIHPLVGEHINSHLAKAQASGAALAVVDIPLLVEGGSRWRSRLDAVWVVDCSAATQIERVQARSSWPLEQIEAVMAAQASRAQRLSCADAVINNDGGVSMAQLREQVLALLALQNLTTLA